MEDGVAGEYGETAVKHVVTAYRDARGNAIIPSRPMVEGRALGRQVGAGSVISHRARVTLISISISPAYIFVYMVSSLK